MGRSGGSAESSDTSATPIRGRCRDYISLIAQRQIDRMAPSTHVMGVARFERFFRTAARLDVDKQDLKRFSEFINHRIYDLILRAEAAAKANGRDIIEPFDLPITKGLQESIHAFREIDETIELQPILDYLTARPPLDLAYSDATETRPPEAAASRHSGWAERRACAHLQDHCSRSEEPGNQALGVLLSDLRPFAVMETVAYR